MLSGGGSNGAWESGVLWGLVNYGDKDDYHYDVVSGVSIGSVNASALAVYAKGEEPEAIDFIYSTWQTITTESIYTNWPGGVAAGLYKQSMFDTSPGFVTMQSVLSPYSEYKRAFGLSAVNIETGQVVTMNEKNTPIQDLYKAVIASASVPGAFPPTELNGMKLVDGMTAYNTNV